MTVNANYQNSFLWFYIYTPVEGYWENFQNLFYVIKGEQLFVVDSNYEAGSHFQFPKSPIAFSFARTLRVPRALVDGNGLCNQQDNERSSL